MKHLFTRYRCCVPWKGGRPLPAIDICDHPMTFTLRINSMQKERYVLPLLHVQNTRTAVRRAGTWGSGHLLTARHYNRSAWIQQIWRKRPGRRWSAQPRRKYIRKNESDRKTITIPGRGWVRDTVLTHMRYRGIVGWRDQQQLGNTDGCDESSRKVEPLVDTGERDVAALNTGGAVNFIKSFQNKLWPDDHTQHDSRTWSNDWPEIRRLYGDMNNVEWVM